MLELLNHNPALLSLVSTLILGALLFAFLSWRIGRMQRQLYEYRRQQKAQQLALIERISIESGYSRESVAQMYKIYQEGAQNSERRIEMLSENIERRLNESVTHLQDANEKRLGASFRQVSEQLARVHQGLGEMQTLAQGVGDLKRVLSGVKTRGIWGELRLKTLLEENLAPSQYLVDTPVAPNEKERVEFAVKLPGKTDGECVLLPIDAKFPQEDYHRLVAAREQGDRALEASAEQALDRCLLTEAKRISDKYIRIPHTTDFAVMVLPIEGLYAESLRRPELFEKCRNRFHIVIAGPTTLSALLNSLQMGFRSVAVEKRSEEIWNLLGSVREEFAKYGDALERTKQKLEQATGELDTASARTRAIHRRLRQLEKPE